MKQRTRLSTYCVSPAYESFDRHHQGTGGRVCQATDISMTCARRLTGGRFVFQSELPTNNTRPSS